MSTSLNKLLSMTKYVKLLYVENDYKMRSTTTKLLNDYFDSVVVAVDGQDGIEKFQNNSFDLIISEINIPKINGLDMLTFIRKQNSEIPFIVFSALIESKYFIKAIEIDIDAYLLKPLILENFEKVLYKVSKKINALALSDNYHKELEEEVKKRNAEIEHKLCFDSLTGLYSRYSFFNHIKDGNSPVIMLIDIDKFNVINEVYGSEIGSKVLQKFATYLGLTVNEESCMVYRLSADEYAIVDSVGYIDPDKYEILLEKLFKNLDNFTMEIDKYSITVDITVGISTVDGNGYDNAKIALDYAKKHKKQYKMYSSAIDPRKESTSMLKIRDKIVSAIDDEGVVAVYQPIVDKNAKIIKYETLMRLRDKNSLKLQSPFYFLDVACKTRLYEKLSSIIIFKALHLLKTTHHEVSVNLTYSDIRNVTFINKIEDFLRNNENIGNRIVFEIVENEGIENYSSIKKFIKHFRKYGVRIAIDDFGSGFSNFEHILEIEPDYLKIDGSLVKDIDKDNRAYTLVKAIVEFSHKLGISVIAEYVHSKVIFDMLMAIDVDEYQGFYFSEPLEEIGI